MKMLYNGQIYEQPNILLEAYTEADINRVYGSAIENYIKSHKDVYGETVPVEIRLIKENIISEIIKVDPSSDKKYLGVITQWLLTKRPEDLRSQIKEYLVRFKKILDLYPGGEVGNLSKVLSKGKIGLDEFKQKVIDLEKKFANNLANPDIKANEANSNYKIVNQNNKYVCFEIDRWIGTSGDEESDDNKHICFKGDVDWCVKYKSYFDNYKPPYYYFMEKATGREYALMHIGSSQLKDVRDSELGEAEVEPIADLIYQILKDYIASGESISFTGDFEVLMSVFGDDKTKFAELKMYITTWFSYVENRMASRMEKLLSEYEFGVDIRDSNGNTALILNSYYKDRYSFEMNSFELADLLIKLGADVNAIDDKKRSALFVAVKERNTSLCKLLLSKGADPNLKDAGDFSMLSYVVGKYSDHDILEVLLDGGADPNVGYDDGSVVGQQFPLHFAIRNGALEAVKLLLAKGANPNLIIDPHLDVRGRNMNALELAEKYGHHEMVDAIIPYMNQKKPVTEAKVLYKGQIYEARNSIGKASLMEMPNMINSLEDNPEYELKQMEKLYSETEEDDSQWSNGTEWSIRLVPDGSRGLLYITSNDEPVGYCKFSKAYSIPNAITIQYTYLLDEHRGYSIMSTGYEYLLNYFGAIISDSDLTDDSMGLYLKLSKTHKCGVLDDKTKEFKEVKFDSPEYEALNRAANIEGTAKNIRLVIFKNT